MQLSRTIILLVSSVLTVIISLVMSAPAIAQVDRFIPAQGGDTPIWRITHDPTVRDWANYHNQNCWSPDGRYLCYTRYRPYDNNPESVVYIYDLYEDKEIRVGEGSSPRWGKVYNWLLWVAPSAGAAGERPVMWLDVATGKSVQIAEGISSLGNTDYRDQWVFGMAYEIVNGERKRAAYRIPIRENGRSEKLPGHEGFQWIANPTHPLIFSRHDHGDVNATDEPFEATRYWCALDGTNKVIGSPMLQRCHQSWSGDGLWHLHGNTPLAGRKWDEPFPSNLHFLSSIGVGDISPVGNSGRWLCGGSNQGPLQMIDLWSGDGYDYFEAALSFIHDDDRFGFSFGSGLEDNDSKGSADGTKVGFVSNYDLKNGPLTYAAEVVSGPDADSIPVVSTKGFPNSGRLSVGNEVVGYDRKTPTAFEGLTRRMYHTTATNLEYLTDELREEYLNRESDNAFTVKRGLSILKKMEALYATVPPTINRGTRISSFDHRSIPKDKWPTLSPTSRFAQAEYTGYKDTPLMWQNRTDLFVAVVRLPDQPHIRMIDNTWELIPGENHWETAGYNVYLKSKKITDKPVRSGTNYAIDKTGEYTVTAVEWSGLEGGPCLSVELAAGTRLRIRVDKPADFSWTSDRWLVDGRGVSESAAKYAEKAVREIVHMVEGVLHREWYNWGVIVRRHDLNVNKQPIRRLFYRKGELSQRDYYNQDGLQTSAEIFDEDGYITESIVYRHRDGGKYEHSHYWYEAGMPVKHIGESVRHSAPLGAGLYEKEGDRWVKKATMEELEQQ
jgi:hypothetical protein